MNMFKFVKLGLVFLLLVSFQQIVADDEDTDEDEDEAVIEDEEDDAVPTTMQYEKPKPSGPVNFEEPFDSHDALQSWKISEAKKDGVDEEISKYNGRWEVVKPIESLLEGDLGLLLKDRARHHAISAGLLKPYEFTGKPFVMQYEVNFQNGIECGGGYVKLLSHSMDMDLKNFHDKSPYTIMFGPDKCGEDYKLHFIFRHKNPKTGEFEEKHAKKTGSSDLKSPYTDKAFHLYTLVINPDNSFKMYIDQKEVNSGSLLEDMTPAVNPPKEIEDKDDKKPDDWDEREKIPDPDASKPDDWNEDAPAQIPDPEAEMPDGWLEDEPLYVDDPDAEKPDDWDDDMDGEWEAPKIENPKCEEAPGCGMWEPPLISNPEFKGKWKPPMIANPAYKGIWKPRMIPNPDYFEDLEPYKMSPIGAIGLELWSMSSDIMFDNFIMTDDKSVADNYAEQTWKLKKVVKAKNEPGVVQGLMDATEERPWLWAVYVLVVALPLVLIYSFCCGTKKSDPKKTDEPTPDDPHDSDKEEDAKEEEGEKETTEEKESAKEEEEGDDAEGSQGSQDEEPSQAAGDAKKKPSKEDLEDEESEEEEPAKEEKTQRRKSPRSRARKD